MKKVILITGASSGMGKETALQLIREGHVVYGAARRESNMQELVKAGGHAVKLDITNAQQVKDVIEKIISEQGKIDVLVNNAGYAIYGAVEDITIDEARQQFEVNLFGLAAITKAVLPYMRKQQTGEIINISSMGGKMYTPLGAWYHATKHALEGWSDSLRLELKDHGIHVVIIEPGIIKTEFDKVMYEPMIKRSGNGPYANLTKAVAKGTLRTYKKGSSSPSTVVAKVISRAIRSNKPKTRYVVGKMAKPMIWIRKNLGDRVFDALLMSQVK